MAKAIYGRNSVIAVTSWQRIAQPTDRCKRRITTQRDRSSCALARNPVAMTMLLSGLTFLTLVASSLDAGAASIAKGPYLLYPFENSSMKVLWQTDQTPVDASVEWWEIPEESQSSGPLSETGNGLNEHQFSYTITGLTPATHYQYRVTVDSVQETGSFLTAPPDTATSVTVYGYGDSRYQPGVHDGVALRLLADVDVDAGKRQTIALHTGDLVDYGDLESEWNAHFFARSSNLMQFISRMPVLPCKGNHELPGELLKKYLPYVEPAQEGYYYSFDYGPVHVAVVDLYVDALTMNAQLLWLEADLASTDRLWRIIVLHEPLCSAGGRHGDNVWGQVYLHPLFLVHNVAIVMSGHTHYYARCVVGGIQYITTGSAGAVLDDYDLERQYVVSADKSYHFARYDISGKQMIVTAIRENGSVIESFALRNDGESVEAFLKGDVDGDGDTDMKDLVGAMQATVGPEQAAVYTGADVNGDGRIGVAEAVYVMQRVSGLR